MISRATGTIDLHLESDDYLCYPSEAWTDLAPKVKHLHLISITGTSAVHPAATQADAFFQILDLNLDTPDLLAMFAHVGPTFRPSLQQGRGIEEAFVAVIAKYEEAIKIITLYIAHQTAAEACLLKGDVQGAMMPLFKAYEDQITSASM